MIQPFFSSRRIEKEHKPNPKTAENNKIIKFKMNIQQRKFNQVIIDFLSHNNMHIHTVRHHYTE